MRHQKRTQNASLKAVLTALPDEWKSHILYADCVIKQNVWHRGACLYSCQVHLSNTYPSDCLRENHSAANQIFKGSAAKATSNNAHLS